MYKRTAHMVRTQARDVVAVVEQELLRRARSRRMEEMVRQARSAGSKVVTVVDGVGGRQPAAVTAPYGCVFASQVIQLETEGALHLFAKPYDGVTPMAGEHHTWLPGALRGSAAFCQEQSRFWWDAGDDFELANQLGEHPRLTSALLALGSTWGPEHRGFEFDWRVQLRPLTGGCTHIAMVAPREDLTAFHVGFEEFAQVCTLLDDVLRAFPDSTEAPFIQPTAFGSLFERVLYGSVDLSQPKLQLAIPL